MGDRDHWRSAKFLTVGWNVTKIRIGLRHMLHDLRVPHAHHNAYDEDVKPSLKVVW